MTFVRACVWTGTPNFETSPIDANPSCGSESCMSRGCQIMSIVALSCVVSYVMFAMILYFHNFDSSHREYSCQPTGTWYANNFGSLLFVKISCMLFPDVLFMNVLLTLLPIVANWLLWKKILWLSHVTSMATH